MTELLTAEQMRAVEQAAIDAGGVTGLELMERAGQGVVDAILAEWPGFARSAPAADMHPGAAPEPPEYSGSNEDRPLRAIVLCGPGNNGGDGFVVARLLAQLGWDIELFFYGDAAGLPADARVNYDRWQKIGTVQAWDDSEVESCLGGYVHGAPSTFEHQLVVDALFGLGLSREMPEDTQMAWRGAATITEPLQSLRPKYVAVDIPSGLCSDTGQNRGAFPSDLCVTFHRAKLGHFLIGDAHLGGHLRGGPELCRTLVIVDIGLQPLQLDGVVREVVGAEIAKTIAKRSGGHKFSHGHALVLSGGSGRSGAARLAARGALRIGAGLVTLGVPPNAQMEVACQITSEMLTRVRSAEGLAEVLEDSRITSICLGPGLGRDRALALLPVALAAKRPCVLDADALSAFQDDPAELFAHLHECCVLTPHGGEFARLFPDLAVTLGQEPTSGPAYSKVDATRAAAKRAGCTVLLKGADTVIARPNGQAAVHAAAYERTAPWLATAGAGDVLAGFITGLLARGLAPLQAAEAAAWLHVECARSFGPGLIAEDLPEELPKVLRALNA